MVLMLIAKGEKLEVKGIADLNLGYHLKVKDIVSEYKKPIGTLMDIPIFVSAYMSNKNDNTNLIVYRNIDMEDAKLLDRKLREPGTVYVTWLQAYYAELYKKRFHKSICDIPKQVEDEDALSGKYKMAYFYNGSAKRSEPMNQEQVRHAILPGDIVVTAEGKLLEVDGKDDTALSVQEFDTDAQYKLRLGVYNYKVVVTYVFRNLYVSYHVPSDTLNVCDNDGNDMPPIHLKLDSKCFEGESKVIILQDIKPSTATEAHMKRKVPVSKLDDDFMSMFDPEKYYRNNLPTPKIIMCSRPMGENPFYKMYMNNLMEKRDDKWFKRNYMIMGMDHAIDQKEDVSMPYGTGVLDLMREVSKELFKPQNKLPFTPKKSKIMTFLGKIAANAYFTDSKKEKLAAQYEDALAVVQDLHKVGALFHTIANAINSHAGSLNDAVQNSDKEGSKKSSESLKKMIDFILYTDNKDPGFQQILTMMKDLDKSYHTFIKEEIMPITNGDDNDEDDDD